jgi:hypothetical protein
MFTILEPDPNQVTEYCWQGTDGRKFPWGDEFDGIKESEYLKTYT